MIDFIWQNGAIVDAVRVQPARSRMESGFWLGDGLFETMLVDGGEIFAVDRHIRRLVAASILIGVKLDESGIQEALSLAQEWVGSRCGQIRVTCLSSGELIVTAREHQISATSVKLVRYPYPKNERSMLAGIKSLSYGENTAALRYAWDRDVDDVIFLNTDGIVMESAVANLLVWDGKDWFTPSLASGALPGVTRELLVENFSVKERDFGLHDLASFPAMGLTSSLRDVQGVSAFLDDSLGLLSFEQEPVDRLRTLFQDWRKKNRRP